MHRITMEDFKSYDIYPKMSCYNNILVSTYKWTSKLRKLCISFIRTKNYKNDEKYNENQSKKIKKL